MTDFLIAVLGFIFALSVLVCFHEYGHYWVARRLGVKVLRFSLGWGKPWKSYFAKDGVEWALAPFPIGGYVKMLDEREGPVDPSERHMAFGSKSVSARMAILVAGPAANFILAVLLYWAVYLIGVQGMRPLISEPRAGTAAEMAGLKANDEVLSVEGKAVPTWTDLRLELIDRTLGHEQLRLQVRAENGVERSVSLSLSGVRSDPQFLFDDLGLDVWRPELGTALGTIQEDSAAAQAGLLVGDRVLKIDGLAVDSWEQLVAAIRARPGQITAITVDRQGRQLTINTVLASVEEAGEPVGRLGAGPVIDREMWQNLRAVRHLGPIEAFAEASGQTWQMTKLTLKVLWHMVLGEVSVKNVSGPIQIAQVAGDSAQIGLVSFLSFMAVVSVSLGVLNLLPVPLLDGGHLAMYAIEGIKGKPLSDQSQIAAQYVGLVFIGALMMLALVNDIMRLV